MACSRVTEFIRKVSSFSFTKCYGGVKGGNILLNNCICYCLTFYSTCKQTKFLRKNFNMKSYIVWEIITNTSLL